MNKIVSIFFAANILFGQFCGVDHMDVPQLIEDGVDLGKSSCGDAYEKWELALKINTEDGEKN